MIDIIEQEIVNMSEKVFDILLKDRTTEKNICWATDYYISYGIGYYPEEQIFKKLITGDKNKIICPRIMKIIEEKIKRTKEKAEVFTPSWLCNIQNNLIDDVWFRKKNIFNTPREKSWEVSTDLIVFPSDKTWQNYVESKRLEISCGEAPYIVSRYDTVTGEEIPIEKRIGLLDRKLRVINENTKTEIDWFLWTKKAYQSIYGYEYQGDSLLIARENIFFTFIENMEYKFSKKPSEKQMIEIAEIISWNIWQMDGVTMTAPYSEQDKITPQLVLFTSVTEVEKEAILCKIMDWESECISEFKNINKRGN